MARYKGVIYKAQIKNYHCKGDKEIMEFKINEKNLERIQKLYELTGESMCEEVVNRYITRMLDQEETIRNIEEAKKTLDDLKKNFKFQRVIY